MRARKCYKYSSAFESKCDNQTEFNLYLMFVLLTAPTCMKYFYFIGCKACGKIFHFRLCEYLFCLASFLSAGKQDCDILFQEK